MHQLAVHMRDLSNVGSCSKAARHGSYHIVHQLIVRRQLHCISWLDLLYPLQHLLTFLAGSLAAGSYCKVSTHLFGC